VSLLVSAQNLRARIAISAGVVLFAWWLSHQIRHLAALADTRPARLGFEMGGIGIGIAVFAIGIAIALPGPVTHRLGLGRSRLPVSAVIALTLGTLGLMSAIDATLTFTLPRALERSVATGISRGFAGPRGWDLAIAFFGSAIAPALGEELLCRGLIQRALVRWIHPAAAIAITALTFGWLHQELMHGTIATCIGLYLGAAAYWSDSTRPAIAGHAANNFAALMGSAGFVPAMPLAASLFAGIGVAAAGLAWAWRARPLGEDPGIPERELQPDPDPADA
jgi:membrane protease YdiL (CAAX protease family)